MNTTPEPRNLRADLFRAISDPGAHLERLPGETAAGWQHRAVMAVLADHGIGGGDQEPEPPAWASLVLDVKADCRPGGCTCGGRVSASGVFIPAAVGA